MPGVMTDRTIRLRLHANLRDAAGTDAIDVVVPAVATPRDAFHAAVARVPALAAWSAVVAFGSDDRLLAADAAIPGGLTELHALPPVSGG